MQGVPSTRDGVGKSCPDVSKPSSYVGTQTFLLMGMEADGEHTRVPSHSREPARLHGLLKPRDRRWREAEGTLTGRGPVGRGAGDWGQAHHLPHEREADLENHHPQGFL